MLVFSFNNATGSVSAQGRLESGSAATERLKEQYNLESPEVQSGDNNPYSVVPWDFGVSEPPIWTVAVADLLLQPRLFFIRQLIHFLAR